MPSFSQCPRCQAELWIHDTGYSQRLLRCPMCSGVFSVQEIQSSCKPAPPAALVVDEAPGNLEPSSPGTGHAPAAATTAGVELDVTGSAAEGAPQIEDDVDVEYSAPVEHAPAADVPTLEVSAAAFDTALDVPDQTAAVQPVPQTPTRRRREYHSSYTTSSSPFHSLIGIVLGGVVGLALGYVALVNIGDFRGEDKDFLHLKPYVPWLFPWRDKAKTVVEAEPDDADEDLSPMAPRSSGKPRVAVGPTTTLDAESPEESEANSLADAPLGESPASSSESPPVHKASARSVTSDKLGPRQFVPVSASQVAEAVLAVHRALGCEHCESKGYLETVETVRKTSDDGTVVEEQVVHREPCEKCGGHRLLHVTLPSYDKLCQLGEAATFVEVAPDDPALVEQRAGLANLVAQIAKDPGNQETIGRLAGLRLAQRKRTDNGILLVGKVQGSEPDGPLYRTTLVLFGYPTTVDVLSRKPLPPQVNERDRVAILGSIVDAPAKNLNGYQGDRAQVIWGGLPVPLDK